MSSRRHASTRCDRTALLTLLFAFLVTTLGTFLVILLVPAADQDAG